MIDLRKISTEEHNLNSNNIELQDTFEILRRINEEDKKVPYCVENVLENITKLVDAICSKFNKNTRIIYVGSGTSGRLGILDASECPPTYGVSNDLFQGIISGGKEAVFKAVENAEDDKNQGRKDLENLNLSKDDVVIGLAASGRTPYVIGALEYANKIGALTGSITCAKESEMSKISKYPIEVIVGPEIVTGSTRMKSGTAQKLILNMISTSIMIKRGKVFSGYMVDVRPTNSKLIQRAIKILMETTKCNEDTAKEYLEKSSNNVKVAIVMILLRVSKEVAIEKLNLVDNNVSRLIHEYTNKN